MRDVWSFRWNVEAASNAEPSRIKCQARPHIKSNWWANINNNDRSSYNTARIRYNYRFAPVYITPQLGGFRLIYSKQVATFVCWLYNSFRVFVWSLRFSTCAIEPDRGKPTKVSHTRSICYTVEHSGKCTRHMFERYDSIVYHQTTIKDVSRVRESISMLSNTNILGRSASILK